MSNTASTTTKTTTDLQQMFADLSLYIQTTVMPQVPSISVTEPDSTARNRPWVKLFAPGQIDAVYVWDTTRSGWYTRMPNKLGEVSIVSISSTLGLGWEDTSAPGSLNSGYKYQSFTGAGCVTDGVFAYKRSTQSW